MNTSVPLEPQSLRVSTLKYVLVTPAKNEELHIRRTIESVISQTIRPSKWIIVDDESTDRTAEIVKEYLSDWKFIELLELKTSSTRHFGKKVAAFNAGLKLLEGQTYSFIGNLDADISLPADYYAQVLAKFEQERDLGIAGGAVYTTIGDAFITGDHAVDSVGGAVQLFRRECFDQIGGYIALECGGIDAAAEISARMRGWRVQKVPQLRVYEHRRTGSAQAGPLAAKYNLGVRFHSLGYSTVFYILKCIYRLREKPLVVGGVVSLIGFAHAKIKGRPVCLPPETVAYLRTEQMNKLTYGMFTKILGSRGFGRG